MTVKIERVPTGIPGFDKLCEGGFIKNSINLISGGAGSGKTTFVTQFLYNGASQFNEPGIFVSFEEDINNVKEDAAYYGWDFEDCEKKKLCSFLYFYPYEDSFSLTKQKEILESTLLKEIKKIKAQRIVIDPISLFAMALKDPYSMRKQIYALARLLKKSGCTTLITTEIIGESSLDISAGNMSRFGVEEFVADSVVTLHNTSLGGESDRALRILKMRKTNHVKSPVPMEITGSGITVLESSSTYK